MSKNATSSGHEVRKSTFKGVGSRTGWQWRTTIFMRTHRRWVVAALVILAVLLVGGGARLWWWLSANNTAAQSSVAVGNDYQKAIDDLEEQAPPADPVERAYYYSQLANNYEALEYYPSSLNYYLTAQATVEDNDLDSRMSFYSVISRMYAKMGNTQAAGEYHQKDQQRLQRLQSAEIPGPQVIEATKDKP